MYDQEVRDLVTTSTLTLGALRNANQPRFTRSLYVYNVTDTTRPSTIVGTPSAIDDDGVSISII